MLIVSAEIKIPPHELHFSYTRSSGPGGQNVNKVNSKAVLRWAPLDSHALPPDVLARFLALWGNRLTVEGELVLMSDRFRDQRRNQEDCLEKLRALLLPALYPPKKRKKTKPTYAAKKKRQENKKRLSNKKQQRQKPEY